MSKALEAMTELLGVSGDEAKRQVLAQFIVRLAQETPAICGRAA